MQAGYTTVESRSAITTTMIKSRVGIALRGDASDIAGTIMDMIRAMPGDLDGNITADLKALMYIFRSMDSQTVLDWAEIDDARTALASIKASRFVIAASLRDRGQTLI